jgi:molecular chaperone DnaK
MNKLINFGIDLGTTNSLIARFTKGTVEVFKNPNGFKETLPSVVGFRNDRIMVGEQAKTFSEKDPKNVASRFKRKMGTTETLKIKALNSSKTPVELSAFVLKELKSFIHTGESPEAVVITIPASFDTVQSNATKEAGVLAGFKQVVLLQEPIAASLAYANKEKSDDLRNSQWIVYDLGGGTFDVALVKIIEGDLKIVDHEGDNYLGGGDFDAMIVEKLIAPELNKCGKFNDLLGQMKSETGKYNRLWTVLLHKAEEAKIELSNKSAAEIDLGMIRDLEDDEGKAIDSIINITRSEFEAVIKDAVDSTAEMMRKILTRNNLAPQDLKFVLMVGGSTYTPYVRKRIEEVMGIPINTGIDPTNAIAVGAAYFAATKEVNFDVPRDTIQGAIPGSIRIKAAYKRASQEKEELFSAKTEGDVNGLFYRITRDDGAFDSGLKKLSNRIVEDLPLQENAFNIFSFRVLDGKNNVVQASGIESIQIAHGKYSVAGQMLPEDLSLVKDDVSVNDTRLDLIFAKNSILPAKGKKSVSVGRTIVKGSEDEVRIIVVEGSADNHSSTNKAIGVLLITGKQVSRDLLKGTDIDLTFMMSESRDLTVSAYVNGAGQEFSQVFDPKPRAIPIRTLSGDINLLEAKLDAELQEAEKNENFETAEGIKKLRGDVQELVGAAALLSIDDVTDDRFKLDDQKRKLAQELHLLTASKRIDSAKQEYINAKREVSEIVSESGDDRERHQLNELLAHEHSFISSTNVERIQNATKALDQIRFKILMRTPEFQIGIFQHLVEARTSMNDQLQAKTLIETGKRHIASEAWDDLREVNGRLWNLLPQKEQQSPDMRHFTGIV